MLDAPAARRVSTEGDIVIKGKYVLVSFQNISETFGRFSFP